MDVIEMFEICPLEWRYGSEEMRKLFSRENITSTRLKVEVALAQGLSRAGIIPSWIPEKLEKTVEKVKIERIDELEGKLG
ncbi:MAG TPA: adenylosuccinate lyase, partial [Candidatus Bathyarchaeota archaeon]|nr:adenylosuccinate lyase [Candidatus Bathyarchaeota archaeon]